mmetsp:Transcript_24070/g.75699  ORF Transcript_24070/g.75699 Transcript_24070/m.75699 type:complete len:567 (-) Transcript_24070:807-2507(-)
MATLAASVPRPQPMVDLSMGAHNRTPASFPVDMTAVLCAVETLYQDELKPYGRILRKRIAERAQAAGLGIVDIDIRQLRTVCESSPRLSVQLEEGGDWSTLFQHRAAAFVDVYSPQDLYTAELWHAAAVYFENLDDANMVLPGGRYSCAQVLIARGLPFLAGRSLGQVCHIVQLAISQKKLLGYLNGAVVPYNRSQSMVKERCAERQRPCTSAARGTSTLANWDMVRACLQEIFKGAGSGAIPLSNVKRLFRSRFHIELSETALGHAKLSELLQDPRLHDVCKVRLQGHGYMVIPRAQPARCNQISLADNLSVHRATMKTEVPPAFPSRSHIRWTPEPLCLDEIVPTETTLPAGAGVVLPARFTGGSICDSEQHAFLPPAIPAQTPSPLRAQEVRTLPRLLGNLHPNAGPHSLLAANASKAIEAQKASSMTRAGAKQQAPALEATCGGNAQQVEQETPPPQPTGCTLSVASSIVDRQLPVLTPGALQNLGFSVHNTFIHAALPPPTPPAGASCRSLSLPRNMGSGMGSLQSPAGAAKGLCSSGEGARGDASPRRQALLSTSQVRSQ